jgi:hypothetical protein
VKIWLVALILAFPALAWGQSPSDTDSQDTIVGWEAAAPGDPNEPADNWVDSSHSYATDQAQALTEWMDAYFGEPNYDLESAESLLRLDFTTKWDQDDSINNNIRLRGKLQLPRVSKRLNLVFNDESGDEIDLDDTSERKLDDSVGLLYEVSESKRSRFDLTLGINWNKLRPGVRYRFQDSLGDLSSYRLTQRLQYDNKEGGYATSQVELNRVLGRNQVLRWNNKGVYGEETKGVEWLTRLSLFQRQKTVRRKRELGISYFGAINGFTDPEYVKNYKVGVLFRRQVYRKYLFLELEPAYNYRKQDSDDKRQFAWSVALRLQFALERDLDRKRKKKQSQQNSVAETGEAAPAQPLLAPEETRGEYQPPPDFLPVGEEL